MSTELIEDDEVRDGGYSKAVGERLRHIRRQKRLSLQEVEAISAQEFKASVLGASSSLYILFFKSSFVFVLQFS